ncbi:Fe-S cluster assembly ATPase SufC [Candidatus Gottesmanbacteria bacterium]|nr:Fe-S cluster assembly ATPase SufC [Candidatus Gottesmanbacteria bacterium]
MKNTLEIKDLDVVADGKKILKGINLKIRQGEIHVLMGPNGAGKTSLAMALAGHPNYKIRNPKSEIRIDGKDITKLTPDERAKLGLFISFQKPVEISGVSVRNLLRLVVKKDFEEKISKTTTDLKINEELLIRPLNEQFSGGETKKMEFLQAKILSPKFLILDEIDSGLDIDALKLVAENIQQMVKNNSMPGILLITHYPRLLKFIKPDCIHVLIRGYIVRSDGPELLQKIEKKGYQWLTK